MIDYCLQPHKTQVGENVFCTLGVDCVPAYALDQFMATKQAFGKCNGTFFYHYVQSFSPDEAVTPQEVNAIGVEFASRAWPGHEVLVATHIDRAHVHNHFVINSVNHETGMKLRQSPKTLQSLRQLSDEICTAHGLSVLKPYAQKHSVRDVKNGEYRAAIRSESWKFRLRSAITACMEMCWTPEQFRERMREYGYETVWRADRKHITYVCMNEPPNKDGKLKKCRDRSLSDTKYLKEGMENEFAIRKRILAEIEHGRADADERAADPALDLAGRGTQTAGSYEHGADKYAPGADTGDRGAEIPSGSTAGGADTGWEVSREKLCGEYHGQSADRGHEEHEDGRARDTAADGDAWLDAVPRYVDLLAGLFPRPSLKGKTREEVQREIDAEREAKNVGAAMGIPLTVVLLLIQKAKADDLDNARDVFAHARPGVAPAPIESVVFGDGDEEADDLDGDDDDYEIDNGEEDEYDSDNAVSDDDEGTDDLDEDDEPDYGYDDDGKEVYDEEDDFDPDDDQDEDDSHGFQMKLW
ncbi:MAG: relaxase/mobilization nuclease domain-containing protein [Clostridiales bacterium]|nr:relaxase/mobilization nuclease domain-containing protein [Clostridiales bacterium]